MILYQTLSQVHTLVFLQYIQVTFAHYGEESSESGTDEIGEAEWTQNFGGITIDSFIQEMGPKLPNGFDTAVVTPVEYLSLLLSLRCLN